MTHVRAGRTAKNLRVARAEERAEDPKDRDYRTDRCPNDCGHRLCVPVEEES